MHKDNIHPASLVLLLLVALTSWVTFAKDSAQDRFVGTSQHFKSGQLINNTDKLVDCDDPQRHNCLSIDNVSIGGEFDKLEVLLGKPWHILPRKDGSIDSVYPLRVYQNSTAYWVISHKNNRIITVQLTGNSSPKALLFAGLQLGDTSQKVIDAIGQPTSRRQYDNSNAYLWDYSPQPFTLEIDNNQLYSFRLFEPNSSVPASEVNGKLKRLLTDESVLTSQTDTQPDIIVAKVEDTVVKPIVKPVVKVIADPITKPVTKAVAEPIAKIAPKVVAHPAEEPIEESIEKTYNKVEQAVINNLTEWTTAWSQKDMLGYFNAYTPTYVPLSSASRTHWEEKRTKWINKPQWVRLKLSDFDFIKQNASWVTVAFWLDYQSPGYSDKTLKHVKLKRVGKRWFIFDELNKQISK